MKIIQLPLSELHPYKNNPRKNAKAVNAVAESIKQFGFLVPIVLSSDGEIVTGDTRYKAAKKLKLKTVPCVIADELTPEQIKAFRLADNKVGEIAEWDVDLLTAELADIAVDMSAFGFALPDSDEEDESGSTSKDSSFNYQEQYGVIVMCTDEDHQKEVYETLAGMGYDCKVVAT